MIDQDHLTTREKIMHAEKHGTVSRARNIEKNAAMHCNVYTLCIIRGAATRNGSRNGYCYKLGTNLAKRQNRTNVANLLTYHESSANRGSVGMESGACRCARPTAARHVICG